MKFTLVLLSALAAGTMANPLNNAYTIGSDLAKTDVSTYAFNLGGVVERGLEKRSCAACPANAGKCNYQAMLNACGCRCDGTKGTCTGGPNCGADAKACTQQCSCVSSGSC